MNDIVSTVKNLLENKTIDVFIGYEKGTRKPRPFFATEVKDAEKLIFDENCTGNLAVYLTKKDLVEGKKVGIAASYYALKNIVFLFSENQLKEENLLVIALTENSELEILTTLNEIKQYLSEAKAPSKQEEEDLAKKIEAMTLQERWAFWNDELSKCFKCYACRSACPMCYCTKCVVEINRPQWIQPWPSVLSNMEWQISRVMHQAGRCSDCGSCGAACPFGIPIHILTHQLTGWVKENFGESSEKGNVLSTFKPDDKESFIV